MYVGWVRSVGVCGCPGKVGKRDNCVSCYDMMIIVLWIFLNPVLLFVIISLTACNVALMSFLHAVLKLLGL